MTHIRQPHDATTELSTPGRNDVHHPGSEGPRTRPRRDPTLLREQHPDLVKRAEKAGISRPSAARRHPRAGRAGVSTVDSSAGAAPPESAAVAMLPLLVRWLRGGGRPGSPRRPRRGRRRRPARTGGPPGRPTGRARPTRQKRWHLPECPIQPCGCLTSQRPHRPGRRCGMAAPPHRTRWCATSARPPSSDSGLSWPSTNGEAPSGRGGKKPTRPAE